MVLENQLSVSPHRGKSGQADHLGRRTPGPRSGLLARHSPRQCYQHRLVKVREPNSLEMLGCGKKITDRR